LAKAGAATGGTFHSVRITTYQRLFANSIFSTSQELQNSITLNRCTLWLAASIARRLHSSGIDSVEIVLAGDSNAWKIERGIFSTFSLHNTINHFRLGFFSEIFSPLFMAQAKKPCKVLLDHRAAERKQVLLHMCQSSLCTKKEKLLRFFALVVLGENL
jgi:hypothetical protein